MHHQTRNPIRHSSSCRILVAFRLTLFLLILPAYPAASDVHAQEFPAITVICDRSTHPFSYLDDDNQPAGITIDLWRIWSRKTGTPLELILVPRNEVTPALLAGRGQALAGVFAPQEVPAGLALSRPLLELPFGIFFPARLGGLLEPEDLLDKTLGVVRGIPGEDELRQRHPQIHLATFAGTDDMVKAAIAGRIPAFACQEQIGRYYLSRYSGGEAFRFGATPLSVRWLQAGVRAGDERTLQRIESGFEQISEREIQGVISGHVASSRQETGAFYPALPALIAGAATLFALWCLIRLHVLRRQARSATENLNRYTRELELSHRTLLRGEEWLRTTLDSIGDAVIVTDDHGRVVRLNPIAEAMTGWSTEEASGASLPEVFRIVNAATREVVENPAQKVLTLGRIVGLANHTILISRTGAEYQIADSGAPIRHTDGSITGVVLVFRDVTQEYATQQAISDREQQFRLAIDGTGAGIWDWNLATGEIQVNERWATMLGYSLQELQPITEQTRATLCHSEDLKRSIERQQQHFDGLSAHYECELRLRHKNGSWVWVLDRGTVAERNPAGRPVRMVGTHNDITARKEAEQLASRRLIALTRPLNCAESLSFTDLFSIEEIQHIQDLVSAATGVASIITTPDGEPLTRASNFCRLCRDVIRTTRLGCANCMKSDATLGSRNNTGPNVCPCLSGGLWDGGASIVVGDHHIANWLIGQVRDETQTEDHMREYAKRIGADEAEFITAFREVPSMPVARFRKIADMVYDLARILSNMAYQNVQQARFITERRQAEEQLRLSEENLRATLNSIGDAVIATDTAGLVTRLNPVAERLTGWSQGDAYGAALDRVFHIINADTRLPAENPVWKVLETGEIVGLANHTVLISHTGEEYQIADSGAPIRDESGKIIGVVLVFRDVTAEYALQDQLLQSRKMDAIGQLAGGVAHDFNNMLGGILGSAELLHRRCASDPLAAEYAGLIITAARRAGDLTTKLLSFARKGKALSTPIDAHAPLEEAAALLERTVDKRIHITLDLAAERSTITGDDAQLQNTFLNLGLNAAQAMPAGGTIAIHTCTVHLNQEACAASSFELEPGDYLEIQVRDTGCGIREEYLERIFEPFFTTKQPGKGTGLGLAAVYGTVQQHHGEITVKSTVGSGSCFTIRLPLYEPRNQTEAASDSSRLIAGKGHILFIDDEAIIRATASAILEELGYHVQTAASSEEALQLYRQSPEAFQLVILDLIMPGMSGRDCLRQLRAINPGCRIVLSSGFTRADDLSDIENTEYCGFLEKPFRSSDLSQVVASALAAPQ